MGNRDFIEPIDQELPSHFADRLGIAYTASVSQQHKKENGQFFTPIEIAGFMASYSDFKGNSIRILDPGCGSAILSCALIEHHINTNRNLKTVELVAYETDTELFSILEQSLSYLKDWGSDKGIAIITTLYKEDFILHN
ncbi:MAG: N-6 DNA methylase, partial [Bacteroidales bacterium]|nr:N-6 DNA methylase [Bacteroidales bacterium]